VWFTNNTTLRMTTTKSYDYLNRLTAVSSAAGGSNVAVFNYANNTANQRTAITNVDSSRWVYQYDSLGQVVSGRKYWSDGTPVAGQQFEYTFDDIGNRKSTASGGDALGLNLRSANYSANDLNQYSSREVPGFVNVIGTASNNATVTLWGDNGAFSATSRKGDYFRGEVPFNNATGAMWLTITNVAVLSNYTGADIVTNLVGNSLLAKTPEAFLYDADGNLTSDSLWSYTWDAENRLVKQESTSGLPAAGKRRLEFTYDYQSRRIQKLVSTNNGSVYVPQYTNRFVYDGWNLLAVLNLQSSILQSFTWGLDLSGSLQGAGGVGGLLTTWNSQLGTWNFACADGNGNVAALVNAAGGAMTAQYEYGPFGEVLRATGPLAKLNPFRFSTKYQDDESDYLYYGYRSYNPGTGRWLNRDPLGDLGFKLLTKDSARLVNPEMDQLLQTGLNSLRIKDWPAFRRWLYELKTRQELGIEPYTKSDPESEMSDLNNLYRFCKNDAVGGYDKDGLWTYRILFPCINPCCEYWMVCDISFPTPSRFPRQPLALYACLFTANWQLTTACASCNYAGFTRGCEAAAWCLNHHW
jgi:RHS repeat-associated protein